MRNVLLVPLLVLAGCTTTYGNSSVLDLQKYLSLEKGESTKLDVHAAFGQPHDVLYDNGGGSEWWYLQVSESIHGATFIPFVGLLAGGGNRQTNTATFNFDAEGSMVTFSTDSSQSYENMWAALGKVTGDSISDIELRVSGEMQKHELPYDPKIVAETRGQLRGD